MVKHNGGEVSSITTVDVLTKLDNQKTKIIDFYTCHRSSPNTVEENLGFSQQQNRSSFTVSSALLQSSVIFFT